MDCNTCKPISLLVHMNWEILCSMMAFFINQLVPYEHIHATTRQNWNFVQLLAAQKSDPNKLALISGKLLFFFTFLLWVLATLMFNVAIAELDENRNNSRNNSNNNINNLKPIPYKNSLSSTRGLLQNKNKR